MPRAVVPARTALRNAAASMSQEGSSTMPSPPLEFTILARCSKSKARVARMRLPHSVVETPVFMPVGTQGTLKGLLPEQLKELGCQIMLSNTYHLGHRPGHEVVRDAGGLHKMMNWDRSLLTDSGGFQMVSLAKLMSVREEGVEFESPHTGETMLLSPERSVQIQNALGADILMQLDDVVHSTTTGPRVEEAMERSVRWLDRCLAANERPAEQNVFAIIQGGLDEGLRRRCLTAMKKRNTPGFAIGGLSGGEEKQEFWRMVSLCTGELPDGKPRYAMGVGFAVDLVVCSALGVDMFDCVFPTRTARFGTALVDSGSLNLTKAVFAKDLRPVEEGCHCACCVRYTRSALHNVLGLADATSACHLLSVHNVAYQLRLMARIRTAIQKDAFPGFVRCFLREQFPSDFPSGVPAWAADALASVNITLA